LRRVDALIERAGLPVTDEHRKRACGELTRIGSSVFHSEYATDCFCGDNSLMSESFAVDEVPLRYLEEGSRLFEPVVRVRNQCDGCARGLVLEGSTHYANFESFGLRPVMACTADRYVEAAPVTPEPERQPMILYTVTTLERDYPQRGKGKRGDLRTPVICTTLERARDIVESNSMDIYETSYTYAVIESVVADEIYPHAEPYVVLWYKWEGSYEEGRYVPIEAPEAFERVVGWGIG
jgi:hypothetical protein